MPNGTIKAKKRKKIETDKLTENNNLREQKLSEITEHIDIINRQPGKSLSYFERKRV
jgi:hypothetical protein